MPRSARIHRLRRRLVVLGSLSGALVLAGGGGFAALENHVASSYWAGVWWALSLMTTVGFVGGTPQTLGGRLLSAALMIAGFALMTVTTAAVASTLVRTEEEPDLDAERDFARSTRELLADIVARLERIETALGVDHERDFSEFFVDAAPVLRPEDQGEDMNPTPTPRDEGPVPGTLLPRQASRWSGSDNDPKRRSS